MTPLSKLLDTYRQAAITEREKGTYFEELILCYLRHEASYRDLYAEVWRYADWAEQQGLDKRDTGIDLVAQTYTGENHAIPNLMICQKSLAGRVQTLFPFMRMSGHRMPQQRMHRITI